VRRALMESWVGRETAAMSLPPSQVALDPTDVILLEHDGRSYEFRIDSISDSESRAIETILQDREVYDLPPGSDRAKSTTRVSFYPAPEIVLMNLPQLSDDYDASAVYLAAHVSPWPGNMALYRSIDGEEDFTLVTSFISHAKIGWLETDLYAGPLDRFDLANSLQIRLDHGEMTSVSDSALFSGSNALAIESAPGVWEILQAGEVELVETGRYRLSRLLRGQRGTEDAMAAIVGSGVRVVVLDSRIVAVPVSSAEIGLAAEWRCGPAAKAVSSSSYTQTGFTPAGRGLMPFSGAQAAQPWRKGRIPGGLTISWLRRSRLLSADLWSAGDVELADQPESYEVDILAGGVVIRTLASGSGPGVVYTEADQIADFGALLGPEAELEVRIYQVAALVGRGIVLSETLNF
jgi:hypothetical protein